MATYTDDFERASLGANWTVASGTPQIYGSSDFGGGSGTTDSIALYNAGTSSSGDVYSECVFSTYPTGGSPNSGFLYHRMDGSGNGYCLRICIDSWLLYRVDTVVLTLLDSDGYSPSTGVTWRFESNGSTHRVLYNGSEIGSASDSTHTSGRNFWLAERSSDNSGRIESWGGGDLSAGAATPLAANLSDSLIYG